MQFKDKKMHDLIAERAAEWYVAMSEGDLGRRQAREFVRWLRTSPTHVKKYLEITVAADDLAEAARADPTPLAELLARDAAPVLQLQVNHAGAETSRGEPRIAADADGFATRKRAVRMWSFRATAASIAVALVFACWQWIAMAPHVETFAAGHEEGRVLWLPDHTLVQLDSDSSITIRFDRHGRQVALDQGRAYFDVAEDSARPFSVRAGHSVIRDIGTVFGVDRRSPETVVTVAQGRVELWNDHVPGSGPGSGLLAIPGKQKIDAKPLADLSAGEQAQIDASGDLASIHKVDTQQALVWTQGRVAFDSQTIGDVTSQLNRYNRVQIVVLDPHISAQRVTGVLKSRDESAFLAFLENLPGVAVERRDSTVIVYAK